MEPRFERLNERIYSVYSISVVVTVIMEAFVDILESYKCNSIKVCLLDPVDPHSHSTAIDLLRSPHG